MDVPPKILIWLLDICCPLSRPDLKGDFLELYEHRLEKSGRFYANRKFFFDILTIVPLKFIIGGDLASKPSIFLLGTNLIIARRNLAKNGLYSFINVFGLSISFTACILITLFVRDELSFDRDYPDNERIFRIAGQYSQREGQSSPAASTSYLLLPTIEGVPGIEKICRLDFRFDMITVDGDKQYIEPEIVYADSTFFDIFSLPFIMGNSSTALDDPNSVVLDETTAKKYFGAENPFGKSIQLNDKLFNVSGVIKDFPPNSHFTARLIFPISGIELWYADWVKTNFSGTGKYTYFKAAENFNEEEFVTTVNKLFAARWPNDKPPTFFLQPLTSIHLGSNLDWEIHTNGNITTVYIFALIALIILVLACINYINLSMATSLQRMKEVGMKRILGSTTGMQLFQFQTESFIVTITSAIFAIILAVLTIPQLNSVSGKLLVFNIFRDPLIGPALLAISVVIGLVAGSFPALALLKSGTLGMLSGRFSFATRSSFRSILITFQFAISIALIVSTLIVMDQMNFIRKKDLGVDPEQLVMIPFQTAEIRNRYETLRGEILRNPAILNVAASGDKVTAAVSGSRPYVIKGMKDSQALPSVVVSHDFFETMGAKIVEGRSFNRDFPSDSSKAYVINESAAKLLQMDHPVGEPLSGYTFTGWKWFKRDALIIGVVKDFHFASLHTEVGPVVFSLASETTENCNWMEVRIANSNTAETIQFLEQQWKKIAPERPFQFQFMNEDIQLNYQAEDQFLKVFVFFSVLSILLGVLGLFGLTAFIAKRRTKEIGIRKIVGASTVRLVKLLSADFLKLVLISNLIGGPIAYYFMEKWLQGFAYRTTLSLWIFLLTGIAAIVIAFMAILYHALKVSRANPVIALKYE